MSRILLCFFAALATCLAAHDGGAQQFSYYDLDALGIPKFVSINYIELSKISQVSKFRSSAGHDYHDDVEACRSMKHYFIAPDATTAIVSPVAGTVSRLTSDFVGTQVQITSDLQPAFIFIIFHVNLAKPLTVGDRITEGQALGTHIGTQTFSDIAVAVNTTKNYRLVSYFDTLTDAAFAAFQARGITSREQMQFTKSERDADPYRCNGEEFAGLKVDPKTEYVNLSGFQSITYPNLPYTLSLLDAGYPLAATASSGLAVKITSAGPCNVVNNKLIPSGTGTCAVYFDQPGDARFLPAIRLEYRINVVSAPPDVVVGSVFSSAQSTNQSFLRFANTGDTASTVKVKLSDAATGKLAGAWTSAPIQPGAAIQVSAPTLETGITASGTRPSNYTAAIETTMIGYVQHVDWNQNAGALTNLSTCDIGASTTRTQVSHVHSSLLQSVYPSKVVVTNGGAATTSAQLGIFDASSGNRLGTYTSAPIPAGGQLSVDMAAIEAVAGVAPGTSIYHYNVRLEGAFTGYLQHLVDNKLAGITSDMTASCPLRAVPQTTSVSRIGSVYSTAQTSAQSFLRFFNVGDVRDGKVTLTLADAATGRELATWTSPVVPPHSSQQLALATIEAQAGIKDPKPQTYLIGVRSQLGLQAGFLQHVVWRPGDGAIVDMSTCDDGVTTLPLQLNNIHSKVLTDQYPSTVIATNTGSDAKTYSIRIAHAGTGVVYGRYVAPSIPSMGASQFFASSLEAAAPFILTTSTAHYNVEEETSFPGFLQHRVTNKHNSVVVDLTTVCRMN